MELTIFQPPLKGDIFWFTSSKHLTMQIQESESVRNGCDFKRPWNSHLESPFLNMCVSLASIAPPEKKKSRVEHVNETQGWCTGTFFAFGMPKLWITIAETERIWVNLIPEKIL